MPEWCDVHERETVHKEGECILCWSARRKEKKLAPELAKFQKELREAKEQRKIEAYKDKPKQETLF